MIQAFFNFVDQALTKAFAPVQTNKPPNVVAEQVHPVQEAVTKLPLFPKPPLPVNPPIVPFLGPPRGSLTQKPTAPVVPGQVHGGVPATVRNYSGMGFGTQPYSFSGTYFSADLVVLKVRETFLAPGPGLKSEGEYSGEEFRINHLIPALERAARMNKWLLVDLDKTNGFGVSFLREAFGGLVKYAQYDPQYLLNDILVFVSVDEPYLIEEILDFILESEETTTELINPTPAEGKQPKA